MRTALMAFCSQYGDPGRWANEYPPHPHTLWPWSLQCSISDTKDVRRVRPAGQRNRLGFICSPAPRPCIHGSACTSRPPCCRSLFGKCGTQAGPGSAGCTVALSVAGTAYPASGWIASSLATPAEEHPIAPHPARAVAVGKALHAERLGVVGAGGALQGPRPQGVRMRGLPLQPPPRLTILRAERHERCPHRRSSGGEHRRRASGNRGRLRLGKSRSPVHKMERLRCRCTDWHWTAGSSSQRKN